MIAEPIFDALLNQMIQISCVAAGALVLTRFFSRSQPHLVHAAWMLLLLKCLTPPVFSSPTSPFSWAGAIVESAGNSTSRSNSGAELRSESADWNVRQKHFDSHTLNPDSFSDPNADANIVDIAGNNEKHRPLGSRFRWSQPILIAWSTISFAFLLLTVVRLWRFLGVVRQHQVIFGGNTSYQQKIGDIANRVTHKLGLTSRARISVVDALIGPAIVGVFRPTILLPKVVVDQSSIKQLETLVAHELIHYRRGDLWWSAMQALAVCLYWCNPLIWVARTMMNREAEKCCDEETIGCLGCSPGDYARCLLSVLECKHSLRAAPLLPGVRPVDITSQRLERIMRLRHGCYSHCPKWVWATLIVGTLAVLPGATLSLAQTQENRDEKGARVLPRPARIVAAPDSVPLVDRQTNETTSVRTYAITEVLGKIAESEDIAPEEARTRLLDHVTAQMMDLSASKEVKEESGLAYVQDSNKSNRHMRLGENNPNPIMFQDSIVLHGTARTHKKFAAMLQHMRYFGIAPLVFEVRILDLPTQQLADANIDWVNGRDSSTADIAASLGAEDSAVVPASFERHGEFLSGCVNIRPDQIKALLESERCQTIAAPIVATHNERSAELQIGTLRPFVVAYQSDEQSEDDAPKKYQPKIREVEEGIKLELSPRLLANDQASVIIHLSFQDTRIRGVDTFTLELDENEFQVEMPLVESTGVETDFQMKLGSTIAFALPAVEVTTTTEHKIPILRELPYVGSLFTNVSRGSEMRSKLILVSATVGESTKRKSLEDE